ncbi:MAG: Gfo/Idh/MocA family oxidoreductase [Spirochaetia bacterium]|nr:Gfo/Idh/MocA family oxidoreductase [Spirochaetia bacterium]
MSKKRYAIVGLGSRSRMFLDALLGEHKDQSELVALCDVNQTRMDYTNRIAADKFKAKPATTYKSEAFDEMIKKEKIDTVIVTCIDRLHHKYIVRAMELGCDVISEKPMTVDEEKAGAIMDAIDRTGKSLKVTFNYRYSPRNTKIKEIIHSGEIGEVVNVHFEWLLDTRHGADYFRRWHRDKKNSGGLLVHKSTHHFDLVNWWLDSTPEEVFAQGRLAFYGKENAEKRGVTEFYSRVTGSKAAEKDPFAMDIKDEGPRELYLKAEHEDGYLRDRSVFDDGINIEDTMSVLVKYKNKTTLTYSLNAFCPWEGYRVMFTGTKGRLEVDIVERAYVSGTSEDQNDPSYQDHGMDKETQTIRLQKLWGRTQPITWTEGKGGHGGGDGIMLRDIFVGGRVDPLKTAANHVDGLKSILVGIAANKSIAEKRLVKVSELADLKGA